MRRYDEPIVDYETRTRRFTRAEYERLGRRYDQREVLGGSARVTPLAAPRSSIAVAQLLP